MVRDVKQVWLADEATGAGSLKSLKNWRTNIVNKGNRFGYYVNESHGFETLLETANNLFKNTKINITTEGKRHLGAVISSNDLKVKYVIENGNE